MKMFLRFMTFLIICFSILFAFCIFVTGGWTAFYNALVSNSPEITRATMQLNMFQATIFSLLISLAISLYAHYWRIFTTQEDEDDECGILLGHNLNRKN